MENNSTDLKKRALKKVRPQFLHRKTDSDEPQHVDPATKYITSNAMLTLNKIIGVVEINRKIYGGPSYMNLFFKVSDFTTEKQLSNNVINFKMAMVEDQNPIPWEYTMKRLESYGDLELATLAHKIDRFYKISSKIVAKYEESLRKNDLIAKNIWNDTKVKAIKACKEVEKNPIFWKVLFYFHQDTSQMVSNSYSQGLIEEMGFEQATFIKWIAKNGLSMVFDANCATYHAATKIFLDCTVFLGDSVYESPELETFLCDVKGTQKKMKAKVVNILEPIADGFLSHYYFVGTKADSENLQCNKQCITTDSIPLETCSKCMEVNTEQGINISNEIKGETSQ